MILYSYNLNDLLEKAQLKASHRAKTLLVKNPELVDEIAINEDEDAIILQDYYRQACSKIAGIMSGYARNLYDTDGVTLLDALTFVPASVNPAVDASVVFRVNRPRTFRNDAAVLIDNNIEDAITCFMLYRIYKDKGHDFESFFDDYNQAISDLNMNLNSRTEIITRSYRSW